MRKEQITLCLNKNTCDTLVTSMASLDAEVGREEVVLFFPSPTYPHFKEDQFSIMLDIDRDAPRPTPRFWKTDAPKHEIAQLKDDWEFMTQQGMNDKVIGTLDGPVFGFIMGSDGFFKFYINPGNGAAYYYYAPDINKSYLLCAENINQFTMDKRTYDIGSRKLELLVETEPLHEPKIILNIEATSGDAELFKILLPTLKPSKFE